MSYKFVTVPPDLDAEKHDFFDYNGELKYLDPIPRLIKDVGQMLASKVMWAIYLTEDPDSKFFPMQLEEKRYQISKNFLSNTDFDWDSYQYVINAYPEISMSKKKARFYRLDRKFDQLLDEIEGSDSKDSINFFGRLESMYKGLQRAEEAYEEEKKSSEAKGSQQSGFFGKKKE